MHEMTLAENIVEIAVDAAHREGAQKVNGIWIEIGQLSCVEADALRFCFDAVSRGTLADGAHLEIIPVLGEGLCDGCGSRAAMESPYDLCPHCGLPRMKICRGLEMKVREIEVNVSAASSG